MLVDGAAITLDYPVSGGEETLQEIMGRLGAQSGRQRGETRQIGEQHGDLAPLAGHQCLGDDIGGIGRAGCDATLRQRPEEPLAMAQ
jgi:hypothetical protein